MKITLFPLNTVLFPESELKLRIFEPRYVDMVSECLRTDSGFGVCLISDGKAAGQPIEFFPMGTYARIIDWNQLPEGLLGITIKGERRFKVVRSGRRKNNLRVGEIIWLDDEDDLMPVSYRGFSDLLKEIASRYELPFADEPERFDEANWVSERLSELLPFELSAKQELLEMDSAFSRFDYIQALLEKIDTGKSANN